MDFIERWLHISPDAGNGSVEFLIITTAILVIVIVLIAARRQDFLRLFLEYLVQLGKREREDRWDT